jgi:hypothetical protein
MLASAVVAVASNLEEGATGMRDAACALSPQDDQLMSQRTIG